MRLALARGHFGPDRLGFLQLAATGIQLPQPGRAIIAGGQLVELLLIPGGALDVSLFLRELRQLLEELRIARVGGQQPLKLGTGASQVARGRISLGRADRHVALLSLGSCRAVPRAPGFGSASTAGRTGCAAGKVRSTW